MEGQDLLVPFGAFAKRDSPEGAKQEIPAHAEAAQKLRPKHRQDHSPSRPRCSLRHAAGDIPYCTANQRVKELGIEYPSKSAMRPSE